LYFSILIGSKILAKLSVAHYRYDCMLVQYHHIRKLIYKFTQCINCASSVIEMSYLFIPKASYPSIRRTWKCVECNQNTSIQQIKGHFSPPVWSSPVSGYLINSSLSPSPQMKIIEEQFQPTSQVKDLFHNKEEKVLLRTYQHNSIRNKFEEVVNYCQIFHLCICLH